MTGEPTCKNPQPEAGNFWDKPCDCQRCRARRWLRNEILRLFANDPRAQEIADKELGSLKGHLKKV